jgi:hypothetical protein
VRKRVQPFQPASDEALVHRALNGDRAAFAVLFDRHRPVATGLVARLLGAGDEVDDVLQEAAVQALMGSDRLRDRTAKQALEETSMPPVSGQAVDVVGQGRLDEGDGSIDAQLFQPLET